MTTRPERIAEMRARLAEIARSVTSFRNTLRESNNPAHQTFFALVLDRLAQIVANEHEGVTLHLHGDLLTARNQVRRLGLPDIDPDLEEPTQALKALRGERGNLVEALDNALDAAQTLNLPLDQTEGPDLLVPRNALANHLIRLDERLRIVQDAITDLQSAARTADASPAAVNQSGLLNIHIKSLIVEASAARFETRIGPDPAIPAQTDLSALARSVEAIRDIAADLKETLEGLTPWIAAAVKAAGTAVTKAAERSWNGLRALVRLARRPLAVSPTSPPPPPEGPPPDFNIRDVYRMIEAGKVPPVRWHPWITELSFTDNGRLTDLGPWRASPPCRFSTSAARR